MDTLTKINVKVTAKAKALSCWIFENVPNKNCSLLTTKKTKSRQQNKPENPARKKTGKGKIKRAKRQKGGEEKKAVAALLVFISTSLEFLKEKGCLRGEVYYGCKVIKSPALIYINFSHPCG